MDTAATERVNGVLFDLDGTLVDTTYLHAVSWWQALRQFDHTVPMAVLHRAVGMGSDYLLDQALGEDRDRDGDAAISAAHATHFAAWHTRVVPLPGAQDLLAACQRAGLSVVLASSSNEHDLGAMLAVLDADAGRDASSDLDATTTAGDAERTKPSPDLVEVALERAGVDASRAVYVGDSVWDVHASTRIGVRCIGLECGGTSAAELRAAGAVETWKDPADLVAHWDESLLSRH